MRGTTKTDKRCPCLLLLLLLLHLCSPAQSRLPENATARSTQTRHSRTSPTTDDPVTRLQRCLP